MRLVLTGGTGVLGRHLLHRLDTADPRHETTILTRGAEGRLGGTTTAVHTDYDADHVASLLDAADAVVHMAASRSASAELRDHLPSLELADRVFRAAAGRVRQIVFASSISVYGTTLPLPWAESDAPAPIKPYGVLKFAAERLGFGVTDQTDTVFTALRFGHLYGAGEDNGYLVNVLMRAAAEERPLVLHAPAVARRDFLYAGDAAHGVLDALRVRAAGVFNIGSGNPVTNHELAAAVAQGFGRPVDVRVGDPAASERIPETLMDLSRSRAQLGYVPHYTHPEAFAEIRMLAAHPLFRTDGSTS